LGDLFQCGDDLLCFGTAANLCEHKALVRQLQNVAARQAVCLSTDAFKQTPQEIPIFCQFSGRIPAFVVRRTYEKTICRDDRFGLLCQRFGLCAEAHVIVRRVAHRTEARGLRPCRRSERQRNNRKATLTDASIQISNKSKTREVARTDILRIVRIDKDSTLNGALIGGVAGAGAVTVGHLAQEYPCDYLLCMVTIPAGFGIGALVGYIVDLNITHKETVFDSASQSTVRWDVRPLVTKDKKGAALTLRF